VVQLSLQCHTQQKAMPRRTDLQSILVLGSGPIVIGQAADCDYSGTQAVRALREEGYRVILVNSNPATIMTDPDLADATSVAPHHPWEARPRAHLSRNPRWAVIEKSGLLSMR
jgi:hypothetical protein